MNRVAIVTGGGGKLGPVWIEALEEMGCRVFSLDLPDFDVTHIETIEQFKKALNIIPDIIINNAALDHPPSDEGMGFFEYNKVVDINLKGAANVCKVFVPDMINHNAESVVVNIGSIMGTIAADWRNYPKGFSKPVGYNISKAGLAHFTKCLAVEFGRYNLRANTLALGPVDTGKLSQEFLSKFLKNVPLGKPISPESCKVTLKYILSCPELTGQTIMVDGGYTSW